MKYSINHTFGHAVTVALKAQALILEISFEDKYNFCKKALFNSLTTSD